MRRLGMTLSLFLLVFLGAEGAIRVVQTFTYGVPVLTLLPGYRDTRFQLSPFLVFGPRVGWEIPGKAIPELARFNDEGFRLNGPVPAREPGEYRIIAVGGSTTENVWNEAGIHWPLVAQCRLRDQGYPVRILNAGMSAYSTAHSLVRLQFGLVEHDPDMILVMHAVNDLTVNYAAAAQGREVDPHYLVKYGARGYTGEIDAGDVVLSRVVRGIRNRLWPRREASLPPTAWAYDLERGVGFFSRNLRSIAHWAAAEGVEVGLLTMPYSRDPSHYAVPQGVREAAAPGVGVLPEQHIFSLDMDRYNQATRAVAQEEGVLLLDMATYLFNEREGDLVDPVHYSTAGILRFGEIVARTLAPSLPVPARDSLPGELRECALLAELDAGSEAPGS
jgi:lysophospholipase L1-like esterase